MAGTFNSVIGGYSVIISLNHLAWAKVLAK